MSNDPRRASKSRSLGAWYDGLAFDMELGMVIWKAFVSIGK